MSYDSPTDSRNSSIEKIKLEANEGNVKSERKVRARASRPIHNRAGDLHHSNKELSNIAGDGSCWQYLCELGRRISRDGYQFFEAQKVGKAKWPRTRTSTF